MSEEQSMIPLESDPDIFTELAISMGLSKNYKFYDVFSLNEEDIMLYMPSKILGLIFLAPIRNDYIINQENEITEKQTVVWFKQNIKNGCGLFALLYILLNLKETLNKKDLILQEFIDESKNKKKITNDEVLNLIKTIKKKIHLNKDFGKKGTTKVLDANCKTDYHYVSFVIGEKNGIYILDGRKNNPIYLGQAENQKNLLKNKIVIETFKKHFAAYNQNNFFFSLFAFGTLF